MVLEETQIRLKYTGFLMFSSRVAALLIGTIFSVYVARVLSKPEYGAWGFISNLVVSLTFFQGIIPFWATRAIARGNRIYKTTITANFLVSIPLTAFLLLSSQSLAESLGIEVTATVLIAPLIMALYSMAAFNSILQARTPHKVAYQEITLSTVKLTIGLLLVYYAGLTGLLLTILIGRITYILYAYKWVKGGFEPRFNFSLVKEWFKAAWLVLIINFFSVMYLSLDTLFIGFHGLIAPLGSYTVAKKISSVIGSSSLLGFALMPKLISGKGAEKDIREALNLSLMIAIPSLTGALILNKDLIYIFGSKYIEGTVPLMALSLAAFLNTNSVLAGSVILGEEKADINLDYSFRNLVKTKIFKLMKRRYAVLVAETFLLILLIPRMGIYGASLAFLTASILNLFFSTRMAFKGRKILDARKITVFTSSSLVMALFLGLTPRKGSIQTLISIGTATLIYISLLYIMDKDLRTLFKKIINELFSILKSRGPS